MSEQPTPYTFAEAAPHLDAAVEKAHPVVEMISDKVSTLPPFIEGCDHDWKPRPFNPAGPYCLRCGQTHDDVIEHLARRCDALGIPKAAAALRGKVAQ